MPDWTKSEKIVMGVDPGFASTGVAVIRVVADAAEIVHAEVIKTEKADKKERRHIRVTNDDARRYNETFSRLVKIVSQFEVSAVGVEAYTIGQAPVTSASIKTITVYGGLLGLGAALDLFVAPLLPGDLKRRFCGKQSGSKVAVGDGVAGEVKGFQDLRMSFPKTKREHICDAAGLAILAYEEVKKVMIILGIRS